MRIEEMTGKRLRQWLARVQNTLKATEEDDPNFKIFKKWEQEAIAEIEARQRRREVYLKYAKQKDN